jgi:hypothetical protein
MNWLSLVPQEICSQVPQAIAPSANEVQGLAPDARRLTVRQAADEYLKYKASKVGLRLKGRKATFRAVHRPEKRINENFFDSWRGDEDAPPLEAGYAGGRAMQRAVGVVRSCREVAALKSVLRVMLAVGRPSCHRSPASTCGTLRGLSTPPQTPPQSLPPGRIIERAMC